MTQGQSIIPRGYCQCGCGQVTNLAPYSNATVGWVKGQPLRFMRGHQTPQTKLCAIEGCERPYWAKDFCRSHYGRFRYGSVPMDAPFHREAKTQNYRRITAREHPNSDVRGSIAEHRFIMSEMLGRPLLPGENVHHKNGKRLDNRRKNLELWVTSQPAGQRVPDVVKHAEEMLRRYAPQKLAKEGTLWSA